MATIEQLKKNGEIIYPVTIPEAVIDSTGVTLKEQLNVRNIGAVSTDENIEEPNFPKYATEEYVNEVIANAIYNSLNADYYGEE